MMKTARILLICLSLVCAGFNASAQDTPFRVVAGPQRVNLFPDRPDYSMNVEASVKVLSITDCLSLQTGVGVDWLTTSLNTVQDRNGIISTRIAKNNTIYAGVPLNIVGKSNRQKSLFSLKFYDEVAFGFYIGWPVYAKESKTTWLDGQENNPLIVDTKGKYTEYYYDRAVGLNLEYRMVFNHIVAGLRTRFGGGILCGINVGYQF